MGHLENTVLKINQRDSAGDLSGYSFHMADVGTDAMEREKAFLFASAEGRTLLEINEALRRVYRGEYGVCESCGLPIASCSVRIRGQELDHGRPKLNGEWSRSTRSRPHWRDNQCCSQSGYGIAGASRTVTHPSGSRSR